MCCVGDMLEISTGWGGGGVGGGADRPAHSQCCLDSGGSHTSFSLLLFCMCIVYRSRGCYCKYVICMFKQLQYVYTLGGEGNHLISCRFLICCVTQAVLRIRDVYPGSRILIFTHPGSRISDLGGSTNNNNKIWASFQRIIELFTPVGSCRDE